MPPRWLVESFDPCTLQDVVILDVPAGFPQVSIILRVCVTVAALEDVVLEF